MQRPSKSRSLFITIRYYEEFCRTTSEHKDNPAECNKRSALVGVVRGGVACPYLVLPVEFCQRFLPTEVTVLQGPKILPRAVFADRRLCFGLPVAQVYWRNKLPYPQSSGMVAGIPFL